MWLPFNARTVISYLSTGSMSRGISLSHLNVVNLYLPALLINAKTATTSNFAESVS